MATGEFNQVQIGTNLYDVRDTSKAPLDSPQFTGTPTAPTAAAGTNSDQIATTKFVLQAMQANDSMEFKGTIGAAGSGATVTALPATHEKGWTYKVITAGNYADQNCEVGDMIICVADRTTANNDDWTVVQANTDGTVTGPASSVNNRVAVFNGTTGKVIKDSGFTIGKSVPSNAEFTDTKYTPATETIGSASAGSAIKADDITGWDAGDTPTLGDPITATLIDSWNAGSKPTLGTAIPADDITSWSAGSLPNAVVEDGVLKLTFGTLPNLQYTPKSIPNVTSVGSVPTLTKTDKSIPNVVDVGSAPTLSYQEKTIPNISVTNKSVMTGITEA